jgi:hypothetical protein
LRQVNGARGNANDEAKHEIGRRVLDELMRTGPVFNTEVKPTIRSDSLVEGL